MHRVLYFQLELEKETQNQENIGKGNDRPGLGISQENVQGEGRASLTMD